MKKLHLLLLGLGFVFLGGLVWRIGFARTWNELSSLGWGLGLFVGLEFAAEAIHTVGWTHCLSEPYRRLSWFQRFRIRMSGNAIAYLTPTAAVGGVVVKAGLLSSNHRGPEAVSGVLVGRLCSGLGHLLFVAAGSAIVVCCAKLPPDVWAAMVLSGGLVGSGIFGFLLLQKYGKLGVAVRWLAGRRFAGKALKDIALQINRVDDALKIFYRDRPRDFALAVAWHMAGHSTGFLQTWWFFSLLGQPVSAPVIATVFILGMWFDLLTFAVPLNMGTLEGSRIIVFKAVGFGPVMGLTYGFALRLAQLSCACFGLANYALFSTGRTTSDEQFLGRAARASKRE